MPASHATTTASLDTTSTELLRELVTVSESGFGLESGIARMTTIQTAQGQQISEANRDARENHDGMAMLSSSSAALSSQAHAALEASLRGEQQVTVFYGQLERLFAEVRSGATALADLSTQAGRMADLVHAITDIAQLLNVLGINAVIEAARAGEAGRGFAVVAREVQALAGRTVSAADEVGRIIGGTTSRITEAASALRLADGLVREGQTSGDRLLEELRLIEATNRQLESQSLDLARSINERSAFAAVMEQVTAQTVESNLLIDAELGKAAGLAANLHGVVETLLGQFRIDGLDLVQSSVRDLERMSAGLAGSTAERETFLAAQFRQCPEFTLLYLMDASGRQVHDNVINPRCAGLIQTGGKGANRAEKDYFQQARLREETYVSLPYTSVASRQLCVTVSRRLPDGGVLAGDLSLNDLVRR